MFFLILCFVVNFVLIYRGLTKGIEWFCMWAMPALIVCALIVLVRVLTLGTPDPAKPDQNVLNGLGFMWNPTTPRLTFWDSMSNPNMWLDAAGQIFFSLSVGFGVIHHLRQLSAQGRRHRAVEPDGGGGQRVLRGGPGRADYHSRGLRVSGLRGGASIRPPPLAWDLSRLPNVFGQMAAGQFVGFLFFFLLFLAALTSSLSMLQPAIALLEEGLGLGRRASVALLGFITAMGSAFIVYFSKDRLALDTFDFWVGTFGIYALATIEVILFAWVLGVERGFEELGRGAEIRIPQFYKFIIKYVSPLYLLTIFGFWCYQ